jgi:hypothetical protein
MRLSTRYYLLSLITLLLLSNLDNAWTQEPATAKYQFFSPQPDSYGINPETEIVIRYGKPIEAGSIKDDLFQVTGEISGLHKGRLIIAKDILTLIYKPDQVFTFNEKIRVHLSEGIKTINGEQLPGFDYRFTIRQKNYENFNKDLSPDIGIQKKDGNITPDSLNNGKGSPISYSGIPQPVIYYSDGASGGNIMTILEKPPIDYLYLFNNNGTLLLAKKTPNRASNFKPHFSGIATYFDHTLKGDIVIDPFLDIIDTLLMVNGYKADAHDILILKNGHTIMEAYDPQLVDMSKVIDGGDPNATVTGLVIQELDENKNLVFEWRSWDHFKITDSYNYLQSSVVDYVHGNSLDADTDTTLIFSSRNLNEITKINRLTGKIIWRLGGKNNEFVFQNDNRGFSAQHSAMRQKNGNLTLFDNGNGLEPIYSRGIEYKLDESNKTVTLINEYHHDPDVFSYVTGNMQRLDNGNTFIFWGSIVSDAGHIITEYNTSGGLTFEVRFDPDIYPTYTAYRTEWDHHIFKLNCDSINFSEVIQGESAFREVNVINLTNKAITITSVYGQNDEFKISNLPLTINAFGTNALRVRFQSKAPGSYSNILNVCQESDSMIVARQLIVTGKSIVKTGIHNEIVPGFEIFPNPMKDLLEIQSFKTIYDFSLCDLNGKIIYTTHNPGMAFTIDMKSFKNGVYVIVAIFSDKTKSVKEIVKQ